MKNITGRRALPRETQPLELRALRPRFVALYDDGLSDQSLRFIEKLLINRSFAGELINGSGLTAAQAIEKVSAKLGKEGHFLICAHGVNRRSTHRPDKVTHHLCLESEAPTSTPTKSIVRMLVDQLHAKAVRNDQPGRTLPFVYLYSCHAGTLRRQIKPGSNLWKQANILIFSGTQRTSILSSGNSMAGAIAYVDHCQRTLRAVDPMKLLFFAGINRGDCVTLMGGELQAPLVWHAPKSEKDQQHIDNLSGEGKDKQRFAEVVGQLSAAERRLLPEASLMEVLYNRISKDDSLRLRALLAAHPELLHEVSPLGESLLMIAAEMQSSACLLELLEAGSDPNQQNMHGETPLMETVRYDTCQLRDVERLLDWGADLNFANTEGYTALMLACERGHIDAVRLLIKRGANLHLQEKGGYAALMSAVLSKDSAIVALLLKHQANPNQQGKDGSTPLMAASSFGDVDATALLLAAGAYPNLQDEDGDTALMLACEHGHTAIVDLLLAYEADPNLQNKSGKTALMHAAKLTNTSALQSLLAKGGRLDLLTIKGRSVLGIAAKDQRLEALELLLAAGAGDAADLTSELIETTRSNGHPRAAERLLQVQKTSKANGSDPNGLRQAQNS